jgi:predicted RNA-binding Zn-ribbon protein involved in translation (DUF1610 family)
MADREPDDSLKVTPETARLHTAAGPPCPECAARLTLIRDAELVSVYKCPKCGHLTAPVKGN